jgi:hypothetical protein
MQDSAQEKKRKKEKRKRLLEKTDSKKGKETRSMDGNKLLAQRMQFFYFIFRAKGKTGRPRFQNQPSSHGLVQREGRKEKSCRVRELKQIGTVVSSVCSFPATFLPTFFLSLSFVIFFSFLFLFLFLNF